MIGELRVFEGIAKRVMENRERYWLNVVARVRPNLDERAARARRAARLDAVEILRSE